MGWGGLDAPAPYAGTRWGAGWSPLLLLNLPASEDSSCTIQIKQMTKGTRVGMGPRSRVAFSGKLMSTGDHKAISPQLFRFRLGELLFSAQHWVIG